MNNIIHPNITPLITHALEPQPLYLQEMVENMF